MLMVGIGEYAITDDLDEIIITHALGSCVALIIHCPTTKHTALAHIVLPEVTYSEQSKNRGDKPSYYADVIVPKLMEKFLNNTYFRGNHLLIQLVGGANSLNKEDSFHVGFRNIEMIKNILRSYGIVPYKMDVGGNISRTVSVNVKDGNVIVKSHNMIL